MKAFIFLIGLALSVAAHAEISQLPLPPSLIGVGQSGTKSCAGSSFNTDGSVNGACLTKVSTACSGRGCQPVTMITTYAVSWDAAGNPGSAIACSTTRHHPPQTDVTTYAPGFDATNCHLKLGTGTGVVIDGVPFYYVTTSASGAELVNSNSWGYLYLP